MDFSPVHPDERTYADYVGLFAKCFPHADQYNREYLDWLYRRNPDGTVVGFDARDGDKLAAHYVCIPARAIVGGEDVRVLMSLNTATHPDYQGQGLFTRLAELTYAFAGARGYDCVYGVANANSTPGFVRKLKFQLVAPLQAMVGVGSYRTDFKNLHKLQFRRSWSADALTWRCASPVRPIISRERNNRRIFLARALLRGACMAAAEMEAKTVTADSLDTTSGIASPLRLFIGLVPPAARRRSFYVDIPQALRPSPLNMIYRSLSGRVPSIDPDRVFFNFLDFDAY